LAVAGGCRLRKRPSTRASVMVKGRAIWHPFDNKTHGRSHGVSPPPAPWLLGRSVLGGSRGSSTFRADQQVVAPVLTLPRLAGRSEANCRISISVAFLPH